MVWESIKLFFCCFSGDWHCAKAGFKQCPYCELVSSSGVKEKQEKKDVGPDADL